MAYYVTWGELTHILATVINSGYPSSSQLIEQIEIGEKAAQCVLATIANQLFRTLLLDSGEYFDNEREGIAFLKNFADRAAQARERNPRASGRGRPKQIIPAVSFPSALNFCALIIGIILTKERGRWPGNPVAYRLYEKLWTAAGGPPHGGIAAKDGALTAWRRHLREAKRYRSHPVGAWLENIISPPIKERPQRTAGFRYTFPRRRKVEFEGTPN